MKKALVFLLLSSYAMASYCQKVNPTEMDSLMQNRRMLVKYNEYKNTGIVGSIISTGLIITGIVFNCKANDYEKKANSIEATPLQIITLPDYYQYNSKYEKINSQTAEYNSYLVAQKRAAVKEAQDKKSKYRNVAIASFIGGAVFGIDAIIYFNKASRIKDKVNFKLFGDLVKY